MYLCDACGYKSSSWYGKCPGCLQWNTLVITETSTHKSKIIPAKISSLHKQTVLQLKRHTTILEEFNRVLGGGIVDGSVILLGGEPGVGKSTLIMGIVKGLKTLYISGEESGDQVRERAERMSLDLNCLDFTDSIVIESILAGITKQKYDLIVVDSIQTIISNEIPAIAGSPTQIKTCTSILIEYAKKTKTPLIIIGHVTKDGDIAGPKTLEHMVDCVLYLEGDREGLIRLLRARKNRFGSVNEVGIFEMTSSGIKEKSSLDLYDNVSSAVGKVLTITYEGSRLMFYEIQALVVKSYFPNPRRVVTGVDYNRTQLLIAIIEKYCKVPLYQYDVYINIAEGLTLRNPLADLGIIISILSSFKNKGVRKNTACIGEVDLLGQVRTHKFLSKIKVQVKRYGIDAVVSYDTITSIKSISSKLFI